MIKRKTRLVRISEENLLRLKDLKDSGLYSTISKALDSLVDLQLLR